MLAYLVREHNKASQTIKTRKNKKKTKKNRQSSEECDARRSERPQEEQHIIRAEEEQITTARTKHEDEEEDAGLRPAGRENKGTKRNKAKRTKQDDKYVSSLLSLSSRSPP